jgi:hypothetical protein
MEARLSDCPGHVINATEIDLSVFGIPANRSIVVKGIGDVNGDGVHDIAIGVPGLASGPDTHIIDAGAVYVLLMHDNVTIDRFFRIDGTVGGLPIHHHDLFGFSIAALGDANGDGVPDIAVGAPGCNNRSGAVFVLFITNTGVLDSWRVINGTDVVNALEATDTIQHGNNTAGVLMPQQLGSSVGVYTAQGAKVLVVGAPTLLDPFAHNETSEMGHVYLIVVGVGANVVGIRRLAAATNITANAIPVGPDSPATFIGSSSIPIPNLNGDGVFAIVNNVVTRFSQARSI